MTADAQSLTFGAAPKPAAIRGPWIQSPAFDSVFLILAPLTILPLLLATFISTRFAVLFFLLAFPHYASTFAFFFWDEYRERYASRWIAFFGGPLVIALAYWALTALQAGQVIRIVLFAWNIWHVGRQSCGILSIYRHRAGVFDPVSKRLTNFAIIAGSFCLAFMNIETHPQWGPALASISPYAIPFVKAALTATALAAMAMLAKSLVARSRTGNAPTAPEWILLITSLAMFHPYLWMRNSAIATAVMLLPHYLQYLGLVWLLHRRKFREESGSMPQRILHQLSTSMPLLLVVIAGVGVSFAAADVVLRHSGHADIFENIYLLLALEHFYLDGLIWAFRDPQVRSSIGPWLTRYDPAVAPIVAVVA